MEKKEIREGKILVILSVMLICVFTASVCLYDEMETVAESGALAVFAGSVRDFLTENDAVAVFLEDESISEESGEVLTAAAEYIARYNEVYADLP